MNKYLGFITVILFFGNTLFGQVFEDFTAQQCDSLILANAANPNFVVIDVRRPSEYDPEHLLGAINRNFYDADFSEQMDSLAKHKTYLIHCKSGGRSASAHDIMYNLGFEEVYNMLGGINAWKSGSFPVTDTFAPLIMMVSDTIFDMKTVAIGNTDTIPVTVTNRANALLIFNEICSMENPEFTTDFDPEVTLEGAFDYTFNLYYEPLDEIADSLVFCIDSQAGNAELTILRTGIDETSSSISQIDSKISFYPNPVTEIIYFEGLLETNTRMCIFDLSGAKLYDLPVSNNQQVNISVLERGIYILRLSLNGAIQNHLLIKE